MSRSIEIKKVLKCKISESNLYSYFIDFDLDSEGNLGQRLAEFVHLLTQEIPNFALELMLLTLSIKLIAIKKFHRFMKLVNV